MKETFDVVRLICYNTYVSVMLRYVKRFSSSSARTSGDSTKTGQAQFIISMKSGRCKGKHFFKNSPFTTWPFQQNRNIFWFIWIN
jgi:hypothetical protein